MWSLALKKPLSPEKLPVNDKWQVAKGERSGKPILMRTHTGYRNFRGVAGFDHQVGIAVPLDGADDDGLPNANESEELNAIENDICKLLEPQNESLFVATLTCGGIREHAERRRSEAEIQAAPGSNLNPQSPPQDPARQGLAGLLAVAVAES